MAAKQVQRCVRVLILILTPLVLLLLLFLPLWVYSRPSDARGLLGYQLSWVFVAGLVGIFWMCNILNIAATSYLVLVGLPLLGTTSSKNLASSFMCDHNFLVFGSITLMMAADVCGLKRRLSLIILKHSSGSIRWIFIDVYIATTWIAMWINSAAATFLMMNVIDDLLESLSEEVLRGSLGDERMMDAISSKKKESEKQQTAAESEASKVTRRKSEASKATRRKSVASKATPRKSVVTSVTDSNQENDEGQEQTIASNVETLKDENKELLNEFGGELLYITAVAANVGGMMWPFGSPMGFDIMNEVPSLTEASWIIYSLPILLLNSGVALGYLLYVHFGRGSCLLLGGAKKQRLISTIQSEEALKTIGTVFSTKYAELPNLNLREKWILTLIPVAILLCITRHPGFTYGWATHIQTKYSVLKPFFLGNSVTYIAIALLLFIIPPWGCAIFQSTPPVGKTKAPNPHVLGWRKLQSSYPFSILMVIGGATCIGRYSAQPIAGPMSRSLVDGIPDPGPSDTLLKLVMLMTTMCFSLFMPTPGTSIAITRIWKNIVSSYSNNQVQVLGTSLLPVLYVASLGGTVVPTSTIPTALVYMYKGKKSLSAWHFLRIGAPLFLCTFSLTVIYALLWPPSSLSNT